MRMPVIGFLLLASLSLCAAAPYNSIIFNEDTEKNIVAKEIEVHFHETNASDQNRKGRLQISFGDVNGAISVESNVVTNNNQGTGGVWSGWSEFGSCSATCGAATKKRERTCSGGAECTGSNEEVVDCNLSECVIDGSWTKFSDWSVCSKTCGEGNKVRSRTCTNPPPSNGGQDCVGQNFEVQSCVEVKNCPIDGGWTVFSDWSVCSKTCGEGNKVRSRTCTNPPPSDGGQDCVGQSEEVRSCVEVQNCAIDGGWTKFSDWSRCSKTCGEGNQLRTRTCSNPPPSNGGQDCVGQNWEVQNCVVIQNCPIDIDGAIDGGWSVWGDYSSCSATCGSATKKRERTCTNPAPANGGAQCSGSDEDIVDCVLPDCATDGAIDGGWSVWGDYSSCSATCGSATKKRERTCTNPVPANGGAQCSGSDEDIVDCVLPDCATDGVIDGGWSVWGDYSSCSATCGSATKKRERTCTNPAPANGGAQCPGSDEDIVDCDLPDCEVSRSHRMEKGQKLFGDKEDSLRSQNGEYDLVMQSDGNLVIYRNNNGGRTVKYETGTSSGAGSYLVFQDDGNLVIYNAGAIVWATNTQSADSLVMQDDGNLVLYDGHVVRWVANSDCFERNTDYPGNDLNQATADNDDKRNSAAECQALCAQTTECKFFTWSSSSRNCWLKTEGEGESSDGSISGPKVCVTCPTGWMKKATGCYKFVESIDAITGADNCKSTGGYLAVIDSQEEQDVVWQMYESSAESLTGLWIGGTDQAEEGTWVDHDGAELTYTNWKEPEEPNGGTQENCIAFIINWGGKWNDVLCTDQSSSIKSLCEKAHGFHAP